MANLPQHVSAAAIPAVASGLPDVHIDARFLAMAEAYPFFIGILTPEMRYKYMSPMVVQQTAGKMKPEDFPGLSPTDLLAPEVIDRFRQPWARISYMACIYSLVLSSPCCHRRVITSCFRCRWSRSPLPPRMFCSQS